MIVVSHTKGGICSVETYEGWICSGWVVSRSLDSNESYTVYSKRIPNTDAYTVYSRYKNYNSPIHILKGGYKLNLPKGNGNSNNDNHTGTHHRGMGCV